MKSAALDHFDVKRALAKKGKTLTSIAIEAGKSEAICRVAFQRPSPEGEAIILKATGFCGHSLWPDRYDKQGKRLSRRDKRSKVRSRRQRKIDEGNETTRSCSYHKRSNAAKGRAR